MKPFLSSSLKSSFPLLFFLMLIVMSSLSSCAVRYNSMDLESLDYQTTLKDDSIRVRLSNDVFEKRNNKHFAEKAKKFEISWMAVEITNYSQQDLAFLEEYKILDHLIEVVPLDTIKMQQLLQQPVVAYFGYSVFFSASTTNNGGRIIIPIGLFFGGWNAWIAHKSNKSAMADLAFYNLEGRIVDPGETIYGILVLREIDFIPDVVPR